MSSPVPPVVKTLVLPRSQADVFRLYTQDFGKWWPSGTHSLGEDKVAAVVFEGRADGRIFERWRDGQECDWGRVTVWSPSSRIVHTWHVGRAPDRASEVEINFTSLSPRKTELKLEHRHWERMAGADAARLRENYNKGWESVLAASFVSFAAHEETP